MLFSLGYSNQALPDYLRLLRQHDIEVVVDVRSAPGSQWASQFNRNQLEKALPAEGFQYLFMGEQLGARPQQSHLYDADGVISYARLAETAFFRAGLQRLLQGTDKYRICLCCTEAHPRDCHRHHLIARVLQEEHGQEVQHILPTGELLPTSRLPSGDSSSPGRWQQSLFGD